MSAWHHVAVVLGFALGVLLPLRLVQQRQRPSVTFAWLVAIALLPYVGVPLYFLFSSRKLRRGLRDKRAPLAGLEARRQAQGDSSVALDPLERLLEVEGSAPRRAGNAAELLPDGTSAYEAVCEVIRGAERSIEVCMFILADDEVGRALVDALVERARAGVAVSVLVDALGCFRTRGRFLDPLRAAGGRVAVFLPVAPLHRRWSANLRNHRKLLIADGAVAWTGGMNFGGEYMGPTASTSRWVDLSFLLRGPIVADLASAFAADWAFASPRPLSSSGAATEPQGQDTLQLIASGPDVPGDPLADALLSLVHHAQRRVWIVTPYFVPDEPLQRALKIQARAGVDVLVVAPERSNHRLADVVRARSFEELVEAGARVLLLPERMLHAKLSLFDDTSALFGSANVDLRSLYLNFELSVHITAGPTLEALDAWATALAQRCRAHAPERVGFARRSLADVASLLAPLL
ncbi:MAG: phospholipase D-like domain-containing protein [Planctomycetota bacterium]